MWVRPPGSLPPWQSLPGVLPRTRPPSNDSAYIRAITGLLVAWLPLGMPSPGSRDACHGRLRGPGRRECWVSAAGGQGSLVEPAWGLPGVWGGGDASDSQKIPSDRYLGRFGGQR